MTIHFGTLDGRAVMADDLTLAAVGRVTEAICAEFGEASKGSRMRGRDVYETPAGFKFIGELINEDQIGGEESAGLSIKGHYPEKDGILARLPAAEAVAARGTSLTDQLEHLFGPKGRLRSGRIGVRFTPEIMPTLMEKLKQEPTVLAGRKIKKTLTVWMG